jgi:SAM-dependent MidA family methyltransferase
MIPRDHLAHSRPLTQIICDEIFRAANQRISFTRFMELALLAPSVGYYQRTANLLGKQGDFVTAPEISPLLSHCLARYCEPILKALSPDSSVIMEIGAGTGRMAADLLLALERLKRLPGRYVIVEVSAVLRQQQQVNLQQWVPHLMDRIEYRTQLPTEPIEGIILANEVMDALPVHRFELSNGRIYERYVAWNDSQFVWQSGEPSKERLGHRLQQIQRHYLQSVEYYCSEVRLSLEAWFASLQACLLKGYMILIDYGMSTREYYHPQRSSGTLRCYYQHHYYTDPLARVGLQDITSDVDFSQVGHLAVQSGLQLEAFVSQAAFLLATGVLTCDELCYNSESYLEVKGQIHQLISPGEMGESCKVLILGRGLPCDLLSLEAYDRRVSL